MGKIDVEAIQGINKLISNNMHSVVCEYREKSKSLSSQLDSIIREYAEYSDVTYKARELKRILGEIQSDANKIERASEKITSGLGKVVTSIRAEEKESQRMIRSLSTKVETPRVPQNGLMNKTLSSSPFNMDMSYSELFKQSMDLRMKKAQQEKEELDITKDINQEDCEKQIKELLGELNGKLKDQNMGYELNFDGDLSNSADYENAIWQYLAVRHLNDAYDILGSQDEAVRDKFMLHWLLLEKQGKDVKQNAVPQWWTDKRDEALKGLKVSEEHYKEDREASYDYYFNNQYIIDVLSNNGREVNCFHFFDSWFEEQYGHLNPDSHEVKRLKYEMSQGLLVDLRNEQGLYDNEETEAFKNARNLWLNNKEKYDDYWHSFALFTNNNKILQGIIDKVKEIGKLQTEADQNKDYEQLIVDGEYRQSKDFITRLQQGGADVVKNEDGTMTVTIKAIMADGVTVDDLNYGIRKIDDLPVNQYEINVKCFDYKGETYIDAKEFDQKYAEYQAKRIQDNSYLDDLQGLSNYTIYADEARIRFDQIRSEYPDSNITYEQVLAMLRMEDERLSLYKEQKTDSERIQDAGQAVLDLASLALACGGFPEISAALEVGNAGISGTREKYDDMSMRIVGLCLYGVGEYLHYADTGSAAISEAELQENARKLSELGAGKIKAITSQNELITIELKDGSKLICNRIELGADDLIKLRKLETVVASGRGELVDELIKAGFNMDDLADIGIKSADDLTELGICSADDLTELGVKSAEDLNKIGIKSAEDLNKIGIKSVDDVSKLGIKSEEELKKLGLTTQEDLAKVGIHTEEDFRKLGVENLNEFLERMAIIRNRVQITNAGLSESGEPLTGIFLNANEKFNGAQFKVENSFESSLPEIERYQLIKANENMTCPLNSNLGGKYATNDVFRKEVGEDLQKEIAQLRRGCKPITSDTVMQKVISKETAENYINNGWDTVGNCCAKAEDVAPYTGNAEAGYKNLRLDYNGGGEAYKKLAEDGGDVYVMRFTSDTCPDNSAIPNISNGNKPPCTETGFVGSGEHLIPETMYPRVGITDGAIYKIGKNGKEVMVSAWNPRKGCFVNVK